MRRHKQYEDDVSRRRGCGTVAIVGNEKVVLWDRDNVRNVTGTLGMDGEGFLFSSLSF